MDIGRYPYGAFVRILSELCAGPTVVTIEPRRGAPFDAVLLACNETVVLYESWNTVAGMPTEKLATIGIDDIAAVRVL